MKTLQLNLMRNLLQADLFLAPQIHAAVNWFNLDMVYHPTETYFMHHILSEYIGRFRFLPLISILLIDPSLLFAQTDYPLMLKLHKVYSELPAFQDAAPEKQPDNPSLSTK